MKSRQSHHEMFSACDPDGKYVTLFRGAYPPELVDGHWTHAKGDSPEQAITLEYEVFYGLFHLPLPAGALTRLLVSTQIPFEGS